MADHQTEPLDLLGAVAAATRHSLDAAGPAVVRIGRGPGRGSGFVLDTGVVVTNAHNLRGPQVTVTFGDGRVASGEVAGVDPEEDLAAITVDTGEAPGIAVPDVTWEAGPGDVVFALSLPAGSGGPRITVGAVSAASRDFRGPRGTVIAGVEHTAPLGRGASGGPLVDAQGRLLAIDTHRLGDGFYLAVPATAAVLDHLRELAAGRAPTRRRLGVALAAPGAARKLREAVGLPERDGLLVPGVEEDGPADRAGVRRGDLLVTAGSRPLAALDDLAGVLRDLTTDELALGVVRGSDDLEVTVRWGDGGADAPA